MLASVEMPVPNGWSSEFVDLSLPIRDGGPTFPGDPICAITPVRSIPPDVYNLRSIAMGTHQATHLDAPYHFLENGATVDRVPLEQTTGPAVLLDLSAKGPRSTVEVKDLEGADVGPGDRLVCRFGWDRVLPDARYFTDMPRISVAAARWMAERRLALVGLDTPTPNPEAMVEVHQTLLGAGVVLLEGLANLDRLEPGPFWLHAAPLLIEGADGAPVRAYGARLRAG
jgi:arylformamidase